MLIWPDQIKNASTGPDLGLPFCQRTTLIATLTHATCIAIFVAAPQFNNVDYHIDMQQLTGQKCMRSSKVGLCVC